MSALRDYFGVGDTPDDYYSLNVWWNVVTNNFYFRYNGVLPPKPYQCVLLGKLPVII